MATYNGERFVMEQITSILSQLQETDELIVVDDASNDHTRERVQSFNDERIRLIAHDRNQGVAHSFQDALEIASNDILFLSDQDDLWYPEKVELITKEFKRRPSLSLVATDAALIDEDGKLIAGSYYSKDRPFRIGAMNNFLRNRFIGCTLAFRRSLLSEILPFPHRLDVLHDVWIGVRASICHCEIAFIPRPLILYRRHSHTATGRLKLSIVRRMRIRLHLMVALAQFKVRKGFR